MRTWVVCGVFTGAPEALWELKWSDEEGAEVHGPFKSSEMKSWADAVSILFSHCASPFYGLCACALRVLLSGPDCVVLATSFLLLPRATLLAATPWCAAKSSRTCSGTRRRSPSSPSISLTSPSTASCCGCFCVSSPLFSFPAQQLHHVDTQTLGHPVQQHCVVLLTQP